MAGRYPISAILGVLLSSLLAGCAVLAPLPQKSDIDQRLAAFPTKNLPLKGKTTIYWNDQQIPFIEASNEEDLAFALGLVHAHLRLGQMEVLKRTAYGRLSEMGGPFAVDADHALRVIDYSRGVAKFEKELPAETRVWLEAFVRGINHYQSNVKTLPPEYKLLGLNVEKWTVRDVLTVGRLAGSDVNWLVYWRALRLRTRQDWPQVWARLLKAGGDSMTSFANNTPNAELEKIIKSVSRSGSNSLAVAGRRSKTGGALIASDPHLGIQFPNFWLIAGIKSPRYHAVGLMVPGLPFIAVGRNQRIAWGGTNMRAASSDLYDVSNLPANKLKTRTERIKVRWWFDKAITVRESPYGPILSDVPSLGWKGKPFAMRWIGHEQGDETTAMLKVARARNWKEFRAAFRTFAVSAQNMVYADVDGNIGQVMATVLPIRGYKNPPDLILDPGDPKAQWSKYADATKLPASYNPKNGFLATANNKPTKSPVVVGHFFSSDDRVRRIAKLLGGRRKIGIAELQALQRDVHMRSSVELRDAVLSKVEGLKLTGDLDVESDLDAQSRKVLVLLKDWDGHYRADSRGALAFELFYSRFLKRFTTRQYGEKSAQDIAGFSNIKKILSQDLDGVDRRALRSDILAALKHAASKIDKYKNWGDMHRLALRHPLAVLPVIGSKYRFGNFPISGSTDTVMKTAHGTTDRQHLTQYGQTARHISDMSDLDKNYFVLLGGQDGWFRSSTALDQMEMWRRGTYVQVPLRLKTVRSMFGRRLDLFPKP